MVNISGRSTSPWIMNWCSRGSMFGMIAPRVVLVKWRAEGVMMPTWSWRGVAVWKTSPKASGDGRPPCGTRTDVS